MRTVLFTFFSVLFLSGLAWAQLKITDTQHYITQEQMFLANEINESGEPFAEALGYNLDDLDPMVLNQPDSVAYTLGIENYEYSRYQLGTIISRSGMGLHMMWAPIIRKMASMESAPDFDGSFTPAPNGFKEDDELIKNIMHFSQLAHHAPPGHPWPQFAEFIGGDPHLPQAVDPQTFVWEDFSTLRWDRSKMDKTLNLAAMGQALMKQYLWAQDMLGGFHDADDNPVTPDGVVTPDFPNNPHFNPDNNVYYGGDGLDGFIGQVLTAEGLNKVQFLVSRLAYDGTSLGAVDLMNYNPRNGLKYFPHKIAVREQKVHPMLPPQAASLSVVDASSDLWDQLSFLWGTLNFQDMMNPTDFSDEAHIAYKSVFDGDPFPPAASQSGRPGPYDLMKGTSKVLFLNILYMHHKARGRSFADKAMVNGRRIRVGNHITTVNAAYVLVVFKRFVKEFKGTPLAMLARKSLKQQANFVLRRLLATNGRVANGYTFGKGADKTGTAVENQAAAIRGLAAAYEVTGKRRFLQGALLAYRYLIDRFYVPARHAFRTTDGQNLARYTPFKVAAIAGALRSAQLVLGVNDAALLYTRFFKAVANKMQLSEGAPTGETGGDSDGDGVPYIPEQPDKLPPVFAAQAVWNLGQGPAAQRVRRTSSSATPVHRFALLANYPNPFNPTTTITYELPKEGALELSIYSLSGQKVQTLVNGVQTAGIHRVQWNGTDRSGRKVASGVYFYRLNSQNKVLVRKMILMQ